MAGTVHDSVMRTDAKRIVSKFTTVFCEPPAEVPNWHSSDGPLMGNGDMGVCMGKGDNPGMHQFWLSKNDFWRLSNRFIRGEKRCSPKTFGTLNVTIPALSKSPYNVVQYLVDAQTIATLKSGSCSLTIRAWVAATENLLVLEFSAQGKPVDVKCELRVKPENSITACGCDHGVHWATRTFDADDVVIPVSAAAAVMRVDGGSLDFMVSPDRPVEVVVAMQSSFKSRQYLKDAIALARSVTVTGRNAGQSATTTGNECAESRCSHGAQSPCATPELTLRSLRAEHDAWWLDFWSRSLVEFDDAVIMRAYYLSQYVMGSASRDPDFPPPLFGVWATTDDRAWSGDYHLNYNHQAPFYALYSSNHIEQADPFHGPVLDYMKRGEEHARKAQGCRGLYYPVGIGPKGTDTTGYLPEWAGTEDKLPHRRPEYRENGVEFYGQRSNAAYCVANIAMRWYRTYEVEYARKLYPFVKGVAEFWEDYLKFEPHPISSSSRGTRSFDASRGEEFHPPRVGKGRYVIYDDQIQETTNADDFNPLLSLGLVPMVCALAIDMSEALNVDAKRRLKWRHIIKHISAFPTQSIDGKTVFRYTERGTALCIGNSLCIQHIYPAGAIGMDSAPEWLAIARNTVEVLGRWHEGGGTTSLYPAAVRVGYDPAVILEKLKERIGLIKRVNGLPGAIEDCSTVPNTINEMMCMSHRQVLRVFSVWPSDRDARFAGLRAEGAFLVSSEIRGGVVKYVKIQSEKGRHCTIVNPWPGKRVVVRRDGKKVGTLKGERLVVKTMTGATYELKRESTR